MLALRRPFDRWVRIEVLSVEILLSSQLRVTWSLSTVAAVTGRR